MSNILGKLNLSFATKKIKNKIPFLTDKYLTELNGQHVKAIQNLRVYRDKGFKELTSYTIERNVVFMPSEVVFTKAGTPRLKLPNGYITASKKYVELTNEPITKRRIAIDGQMQQVRYDVENYITALDGKNVKALSELKVYKDIDFKKTLGEEVQKDHVFKVDTIEVTKGGTPRLKIAKGYVTANQKFVVLTDESVTKKIMIIGGKEHQVRDDIENYIKLTKITNDAKRFF
ncbi:DUF5776 domain-containing protein [Acinetobacter lwoffii]|uniref:DUF5776 domain-containing protein n=1 Tax=Acinetobacter lwoffii TaxID=28090 RepID=A0AAW8AXT5_ACILW|nr:DUF5776 domain-containing protein [Acinetobacter lwoffii]MDP1371156.1 DUF5776 domain-containing protein [Acinetobacter lwoffii]MDP1390571.1 DUF5776 domain-containing protein [Acinetobacter lwoffii]MDP1448267.1 DUF5776 domain-containing protein [Acinetobacter lwoffii]